jgi:hypothetical protein
LQSQQLQEPLELAIAIATSENIAKNIARIAKIGPIATIATIITKTGNGSTIFRLARWLSASC